MRSLAPPAGANRSDPSMFEPAWLRPRRRRGARYGSTCRWAGPTGSPAPSFDGRERSLTDRRHEPPTRRAVHDLGNGNAWSRPRPSPPKSVGPTERGAVRPRRSPAAGAPRISGADGSAAVPTSAPDAVLGVKLNQLGRVRDCRRWEAGFEAKPARGRSFIDSTQPLGTAFGRLRSGRSPDLRQLRSGVESGGSVGGG